MKKRPRRHPERSEGSQDAQQSRRLRSFGVFAPQDDGGKRRTIGVVAIIVVLIAIAIGLRLRRHGAPNVILITIDTLRADSLGFAGNTRVKTPFLDSLAARGTVFTNAHAHNVVTLPSHTNILTGL
jgi:hypothetical protein